MLTEMKTHIDDEYARAGIQDPKILLTTSRDPSSRLTQFVKELRLLLPNSQRINRGNVIVKVRPRRVVVCFTHAFVLRSC
jgi:U3 small nucleolar ribonucleoprotein protein IMP4